MKSRKQGFYKLVNKDRSLGLGETSAHEACMQCVQWALEYKKDAHVYYVVLRINNGKKDDEVISEELIFSYNIEKIHSVESQRRLFNLTTEG